MIPVVEITRAADAVPLAAALMDAGLPCAEITFRTAAAGEAIAAIAAAIPEMYVGAGTLLNVAQAQTALAAGAKFLVAPGFDREVVSFALSRQVPMLPGVSTPTEIGAALSVGLSVVKLFPAEALGGPAYLKAVSAPFRNVRFVPTGGIAANNLAAWLAVAQVVACGGSWIVKRELIDAGQFDTIRGLAAEALAIAAEACPAAAPASRREP